MDSVLMEFVLKLQYKLLLKYIINISFQGNGDLVKTMAARFTSHVFPGETLIVSLWKEGTKV